MKSMSAEFKGYRLIADCCEAESRSPIMEAYESCASNTEKMRLYGDLKEAVSSIVNFANQQEDALIKQLLSTDPDKLADVFTNPDTGAGYFGGADPEYAEELAKAIAPEIELMREFFSKPITIQGREFVPRLSDDIDVDLSQLTEGVVSATVSSGFVRLFMVDELELILEYDNQSEACELWRRNLIEINKKEKAFWQKIPAPKKAMFCRLVIESGVDIPIDFTSVDRSFTVILAHYDFGTPGNARKNYSNIDRLPIAKEDTKLIKDTCSIYLPFIPEADAEKVRTYVKVKVGIIV
ncbi:hypothetical protein [Mangrovibacterium lignilyticum]|uniref:hypothetical protein n=1 Tax=Mangrovibacterium lignilyticum TaxID=2668052 RepID=UPI0013D860A1|nr:hypothetical protein [Mangrovibacterium lignilyticum]